VRILPGISFNGYYQKRCQNSSTKNVSVKEDGSLKLIKLQDSIFIKCVNVAEYNWEYLFVN
jgi:hypothetical protein